MAPDISPEPSSRHLDLTLQVWRPMNGSIVVHIAGELDITTAPRLHELLAPRLASTAEAVILDLSGLRFLGVTGLELLAYAYRRAASRGMAFRIVDGPVCVNRALRAADLSRTIPTYSSVAAAFAVQTDRREGMTRPTAAACGKVRTASSRPAR